MFRDRFSPEQDDPDKIEAALSRRRWFRWIVAGLVGLAGLAAGTGVVYHQVRHWAEERNLRQAQGFIAQHDFWRAQLILEQAVQVNPESVTARRNLVKFYDGINSPAALSCWRELVELSPHDDELRLGLAESALRVGELEEMRIALNGVSLAGRGSLVYHRFAAALALAQNNAVEFVPHLEAMIRLQPENLRLRVVLASVRLRSPGAYEVAAARAELERLARGEEVRIYATMALLRAPSGKNSARELVALAGRLLPPGARGQAGWFELIEHMKAQPHPTSEDAATLIGCMVEHGLAREALVWMRTLEPASQGTPEVLATSADAAFRLRDWPLLHEFVSQGAWGWVSHEVIDLAFAALVQREHGNLAGSCSTWDDTLSLAQNYLPTLRVLLRFANGLGWPEEAEKTLWRIGRSFPQELAVWQTLVVRAEQQGKTEELWVIYREWARLLPANEDVHDARLLLAAILDRLDLTMRNELDDPTAAAPVSPAARAAQLLTLWRKGHISTAVTAAAQLAKTTPKDPRVALVCGVVLAGTGMREASERCLAAATPAHLLPEERALLDSANEKNTALRKGGVP